ncbi:ABC transporter permease [Paracoccus sp. YIM 132242]|uniref:Xylose transport system permease protein XylH n=1 Tax=Paracoccus lichenicola TaxID=2665644 RepID=A0A6L6HTI5_9RHOB|nr:ABC transporter permease [Paracoccus lichenicola]MTE01543.1 ABC transporter permease [Paracoccus lichenicola]
MERTPGTPRPTLPLSRSGTSQSYSISALFRRPETGAFVGMVLVFLFFSYFGYDRNFLSSFGTSSWVNMASTIGIIAIPVGFLMIAGELDISIGAMVPAAKMSMAIACGYYGLPIGVGLLVTFGIAIAVGWINGMLVTRTKVPSLIVTLATLFAISGLTLFLSLWLTDTTSQALTSPAWAKFVFGDYHVWGFQSSVFWWIAIAIALYYVLHLSPWGNWIFALGGDKESARNAGIPIDRLKVSLFILTAVAAALSGVCETVLSNSATTTTNFALIFNCIIAVVVGGVLLTGGFGTVAGVVFGTATLAIVQQGIGYTPFDRNLSSLIIGVLLLIAVLMNDTFRDLATSMSTARKAK